MSEMLIGATHSETLSFGADVVAAFAQVTGDHNPIHVDDAAARARGFRQAIVHGMLAASAFSRILGTVFPGSGTIYLSQTLSFLAPVFVGETVTARLEVVREKPGKAIYFIKTDLLDEAGIEVKISGEAIIKYLER